MRELFSFPNPVNENAARVVAGPTAADGVLILFLPAAGLESIVGYCVAARCSGC